MTTQTAPAVSKTSPASKNLGPVPTAVIVGAGPAGVATAQCLAKRGWRCEVFEKRELVPQIGPSKRGYPMVLNGRATATLQLAGLDITCAGAQVPQQGIYFNGRPAPILAATGNETGHDRSFLVDRQSLGYGMYQAASSEQNPVAGNINWHFGAALDTLDLEERRAEFKPVNLDGQKEDATVSTIVEYDLLVGADGYKSAVRSELEKKNVLSSETILSSCATYKTFHNLPASIGEEVIPGITAHKPRQYVYFFRHANAPSLAIWKTEDNTMSGMIAGASSYAEGDLESVLSQVFSNAPEVWKRMIVEQTKEGVQEPSPFGHIMKLSQFHGPSVVLIGDSAHAVTSGLGQGCNLALESVRVFINTLDKVGLEKAPEVFSKERMADAHAFQMLEFNQAIANSRSSLVIYGEQRDPTRFEKLRSVMLLMVSTAPMILLNKLLPNIFKTPMQLMALLRDHKMPYGKAMSILRVQMGLVVATGLAMLLAATSVAASIARTVLA